jgi:hypothetical protein
MDDNYEANLNNGTNQPGRRVIRVVVPIDTSDGVKKDVLVE